MPVFGKAVAFYEIEDGNQHLVVYHKLDQVCMTLNLWRGQWSESLHILDVSCITDIIGIWSYHNRVYPLRKHPGLDWLTNDEKGVEMKGIHEEEDEDV
jgi:hypothetical protein